MLAIQRILRLFYKWPVFLFLSVLSVSCATEQKITETLSGRPEIVLAAEDLDIVHASMIDAIQQRGYALEEADLYSMRFSRPLSQAEKISLVERGWAQEFAAMPDFELNFSISPFRNETRLTASYWGYRGRSDTGEPVQRSLVGDVGYYNAIQNLLYDVRTRVAQADSQESDPASASANGVQKQERKDRVEPDIETERVGPVRVKSSPIF